MTDKPNPDLLKTVLLPGINHGTPLKPCYCIGTPSSGGHYDHCNQMQAAMAAEKAYREAVGGVELSLQNLLRLHPDQAVGGILDSRIFRLPEVQGARDALARLREVQPVEAKP